MFCNRKCVATYFFKLPEKLCQECGKSIQKRQNKFCSRQCSSKHQTSKYEKKCEKCNKSFILNNRAYEKRGGGRFCSSSCALRKMSVNESFFNVIDTEEKAYWLGFLFADGYQNGWEIKINLSNIDQNHLEKFRQSLSAEHLVKQHKTRKISSFNVGSKLLCHALNKHGCVKAKSLIVQYPTIPNHLDRHFIRGVFDGDGCIYVSKKGNRRFTICSFSPIFLTALEQKMQQAGLYVKIYRTSVVCSRVKEIEKIRQFLYENSTIYLERKFIKF